jgi:transposase
MARTVAVYDWFDDRSQHFQDLLPFPSDYKNAIIKKDDKYILSDLRTIRTSKAGNPDRLDFDHAVDVPDDKSSLRTHKYEIKFNDEQKKIIDNYFKECENLYNICADIWTQYNSLPINSWKLVKDVIFKHRYRSNINVSRKELIDNIIAEFVILNNNHGKYKNEIKEIIDERKKISNDKYKKNMAIWNERKKIARKKGDAVYKACLKKKPKREKVLYPKKERPKKPKGVTIAKPAPDETLKAVIREFCKDVKENVKRKFNDKTFEFVMKYKDINDHQTIYIGSRYISDTGIFPSKLGKCECVDTKNQNINNKNKEKENYEEMNENIFTDERYTDRKEWKLIFDKTFNKYYLCVVFNKKQKVVEGRKMIVALDPGEKTFLTFYSLESNGKIGDNMRSQILPKMRKISKLQKILAKNKNKAGRRIKNRSKLRKQIKLIYRNIRGMVNELHKKAAKYLCENYDTIIMPEFKTKPMISNKKEKAEKKRIRKIENEEERRQNYNDLRKKVKMSGEVKFVLSRLSHYRFKKYLNAKAEEYKVRVYETREDYTSQACTKCGTLSKDYNGKRVKKCKGCGYKIDRDINGSRNILLKTLREIGKIKELV